MLIGFVFLDYGYTNLIATEVQYQLILKDADVKVSEYLYNNFDYFQTIHSFNNAAGKSSKDIILGLNNIDLALWETLCAPLTEPNLKAYFKGINLDALHTFKSYYTFLQLNDVNVNNTLSYAILKKALPKGTLSLFKRSIASKMFYKAYSQDFETDLDNQFDEFVNYCVLLYKKILQKAI